MFRLLYVSNCDRFIEPKIVEDILRVSRTNNAALGITGMLLHLDGAFFQVLEGSKEQVLQVYSRILSDCRHWNAHVLLMRNEDPLFKEWSMGFYRLEADAANKIGAFAISRAAVEGRLNASRGVEVMTLLNTFYKIQARSELPNIA